MHSQNKAALYTKKEQNQKEKKRGRRRPTKKPRAKNKKNELGKAEITESLKRERPSKKPPKRTKYKEIPGKWTTEPLKRGRPKNDPELKKRNALNRTESHQTRTEWKNGHLRRIRQRPNKEKTIRSYTECYKEMNHYEENKTKIKKTKEKKRH